MGTRNLTIVKLDGAVKVAQYGQFDGYPTGQGTKVANFIQEHLKTNNGLDYFKEKVAGLTWVDDTEIEKTWIACGAKKGDDSVTFEISDIHDKKYPEFSRNTGAKILDLILTGEVKQVHSKLDFLNDSLFCEWAYELDLDLKVVNIYRGFQKIEGTKNYGPCKIIRTIPFKDYKPKLLKAVEEEVYRVKQRWQFYGFYG